MNAVRYLAPRLCALVLLGSGLGPAKFCTRESVADSASEAATGIERTQVSAPTLLSPDDGAELDNGRRDGLDFITWQFDWSDVSGATEYELYIIRAEAPGPFLDMAGIPASAYDHVEAGSFIATTWIPYLWQVRARGGGEWSAWSESRMFWVEPVDSDPPSPPDMPVLVSPADGAALDNGRTDGQDDVAWDFDWMDVPGATEYEIRVSRVGAPWPLVETGGILNSCYHHADSGAYFPSADQFEWRVRAKANGMWGGWSPLRTFTVEPVNSDVSYPARVPVLLHPEPGASVDNGRADRLDELVWNFDWTDVAGATEYQILVKRLEALHPLIDQAGLTASAYRYLVPAAEPLVDRFNWHWRVRAKVAGVWQAWSEPQGFEVERANQDVAYARETPELISPPPDAEMDNARSDLREPLIWDFDWSDVRGAEEYHIRVEREGSLYPFVDQRGLTHSSLHHVDRRLAHPRSNRYNWRWQVRAKVGGAWGLWSESRPFSVEVPSLDPALPTNAPTLIAPPDAGVLDHGRLDTLDAVVWNFDWADVPGATHYNLCVCRDGEAYPLIYIDNLQQSEYRYIHPDPFFSVLRLANWKWRVRARVAGWWTEWSATRSFDIEEVNTDPPYETHMVAMVAPADGVELDNGRSDGLDEIVWDFDWLEMPGATEYAVHVEQKGALWPYLVREDITDSAWRYIAPGETIPTEDRFNWRWRVRAKLDGQWGPWSQWHAFSIEPVDTDPRAPHMLFPNLRIPTADCGPAAPARLMPGMPMVVGAFVENSGTGAAGPWWLEVWGSRTGGLTLDTFLTESALLGPLAPGEGHSYATTRSLLSVPDGPYTVVFAADRPGMIPEENERDNRRPVAGKRIVVLRPQTDIDLAVEGFTFAPNPVASGDTLNLGGWVRNVGTEDSGPFWIEFWGSTDLLYPRLDCMLCDSIAVPNLGPGEVYALNTHAPTLYSCPPGVYLAGAFADRPDEINELDETNNFDFVGAIAINQTTLAPADVTRAQGPDLVVTDADFDPSSPTEPLTPGYPVNYRLRVANRGTAPSGAFWVEFWGSKQGGLTLTELLGESLYLPGLDPGHEGEIGLTRVLYSVPDGPYNVTLVVDRLNQIAETDEGNNRLTVPGKRLVTLRPLTGVNLVVEDFGMGPIPMRYGQIITFTGWVRNVGTEPSGPFWIEFWGSRDQDYPGLDFFLCDSMAVPSLPPGRAYELWGHRRTLYGGLPQGPCAIFCFADRTDQVSESDETDNYMIQRGHEIAP